MTWLKALLAIFSDLARYFSNKQLIDAGKAQAELEGVNDANEAIDIANGARANYDSLPTDADPNNRANKRKL